MVGDEAAVRGITIRRATAADVPDLIRLRRIMFEAMGWSDETQLDAAGTASAAHFAESIPDGEFHGWVAVTSAGEVVSSGGLIVDQHLPTPGNLSGRVGYVLNVVTDSQYRRQGIARRVMQEMLEWLAAQDIQRVVLHTSDQGRSLYESLGFVPMPNEMKLERSK